MRGRLWSHLISDVSYAELHVFAEMLGAPRRGFERDHYDVPGEFYDRLVAAGAVEAAATALAVHEGTLPPTINLDDPDPECDVDHVSNEAREADVRVALSNSFGFGGQNAVLAFRRA